MEDMLHKELYFILFIWVDCKILLIYYRIKSVKSI